MKKIVFILLLLQTLAFAQNKDYKNFDRAVKYNEDGNIEKAIKYAKKALESFSDWNQPNLLLASIYANDNQIKLAASYLLKVYNDPYSNDIKGIEQIVKLYYSHGLYDEALFYAEKIILQDTNKYRFVNDIDRYIEDSRFAIEAIKNPVVFNPQNLGPNINSEDEEYLPSISIDGKNLVFSRRYVKNKILQEDFFISEKDINNYWDKAVVYGNNLNTIGNEGAFSFSNDKDLSVFTSCDRSDRVGRCDLYLLIKGKAYNAGKIINSEEWESQGCFSAFGNYLYFVSSRRGGYGGKDIWRSKVTKNGFLHPENLGPLINTKYDEMSPFLHPDDLTFYFASNGHVGMGDYDIYVSRRVNTMQQWGAPINIGYPINTHNTENSLIVDNDGKTAYFTSNKSGFGLEDIFVFELPENMQAIKLSKIELEVITKKVGEEVVLNNVTFAFNSSEIDSSSFAELEALITYLKKNSNFEIEIQGHTDNIGSELNNLILSDKRAKAVYDYLIIRVENKLSHVGYGELKPLYKNDSENNKMLNRRTSFVIQ